MFPKRFWLRLVAAGACGAAVGALGPAALWLALALTIDGFWGEGAGRIARLFAWTVCTRPGPRQWFWEFVAHSRGPGG